MYIIGLIRGVPERADGVQQEQRRCSEVPADLPVVGPELGDRVLVKSVASFASLKYVVIYVIYVVGCCR
jgi:hypothetical protein